MKLGVSSTLQKHRGGGKLFARVTVIFVAILLGVGLTYAYFTARASSAGELFFANICADFVTSDDQVYTTDLFNQQLGKIKPGDNFKINTIYLKNTGEYDVYALLEVTFNAFKSGSTTASYTSSTWYNLSGVELTGDKSTTTVEATLVKMNTKTITTINLTVPEELDNEYKSGTATLNIKAHVIQSLLQAETGVSTAVTASRLIYQNKDNADVEHTVYIRPNGGTYNNTTETTTVSQDRGTTITLSTPTREGYTFKSWSFTGDGSLNGSTYTFGKSVGSITAEWQANTYNVTFDYNDGTNPNLLVISNVYVESYTGTNFNKETNVLTAPEHSGNKYTNSKMQLWNDSTYIKGISRQRVGDYTYATITFDGSFTKIRMGFNGTSYDACITYDITSFENGTYTVSFKDSYIGSDSYPITSGTLSDFKIEKGSSYTGYTAPIKSVEYDSTYGTLPTPTREGYTFNGWQIKRKILTGYGRNITIGSDGYSVTSGSKDEDTYFCIKYDIVDGKTYSVTFNATVESESSWSYYFNTNWGSTPLVKGNNTTKFTAKTNTPRVTWDDSKRTLDDPFTITDFTINEIGQSIISSTVFNNAEDLILLATWVENTSTQSEEQSVEASANNVDIYFEDKKAYTK